MSHQRLDLRIYDQKLTFIERIINAANKAKSKTAVYVSMFLKEKVEVRIACHKYEKVFNKAFIQLLAQARNNLYEATHENTKNFFWRNFSYHVG